MTNRIVVLQTEKIESIGWVFLALLLWNLHQPKPAINQSNNHGWY